MKIKYLLSCWKVIEDNTPPKRWFPTTSLYRERGVFQSRISGLLSSFISTDLTYTSRPTREPHPRPLRPLYLFPVLPRAGGVSVTAILTQWIRLLLNRSISSFWGIFRHGGPPTILELYSIRPTSQVHCTTHSSPVSKISYNILPPLIYS